MISNEEELEDVVNDVSVGLQEIQDYLQSQSGAKGKVRFPRGFIKHAYTHRSDLTYIDYDSKKNISYSLQTLDILKWIANRTDLEGPAKRLLNRIAIVIIGSIMEAIAQCGTKGKIRKDAKFRPRIHRMYNQYNMITSTLAPELLWLWDQRNSIHIEKVTDPHIDNYTTTDVNRAFKILKKFRQELKDWHDFNNP